MVSEDPCGLFPQMQNPTLQRKPTRTVSSATPTDIAHQKHECLSQTSCGDALGDISVMFQEMRIGEVRPLTHNSWWCSQSWYAVTTAGGTYRMAHLRKCALASGQRRSRGARLNLRSKVGFPLLRPTLTEGCQWIRHSALPIVVRVLTGEDTFTKIFTTDGNL
ncbi:hypothetical protein NPIL_525731 [Nephila pilipes]|uniref:Uncharacterized protein n=1 Tax=Nephila pilipes TaxID=299642 RepID=A0A8X6QKL1_NEPPI|nr:hypothetical protein NPIL_525731 [Nephila pilipes]